MGVRLNRKTAPTTRTLETLAAAGWLADIAERRQGPITRDLFGCLDVVAVHPVRREFLFVQVTSTSGGNVAARRRKVLAAPSVRALLCAGARVEVWGWAIGAARPRIIRLRLDPKRSA